MKLKQFNKISNENIKLWKLKKSNKNYINILAWNRCSCYVSKNGSYIIKEGKLREETSISTEHFTFSLYIMLCMYKYSSFSSYFKPHQASFSSAISLEPYFFLLSIFVLLYFHFIPFILKFIYKCVVCVLCYFYYIFRSCFDFYISGDSMCSR